MNHKITKAELRALRNADTVTFHFRDGRHYAVAHRDKDNTSSGFDERREIECRGNITDYRKQYFHVSEDEAKRYVCYSYIGSAQFAPRLQTALQVIKPGDELILEWISDGNNYVRQAELYEDSLRLNVNRSLKSGTKRLQFHIDTRVCPNNTARMIRRDYA